MRRWIYEFFTVSVIFLGTSGYDSASASDMPTSAFEEPIDLKQFDRSSATAPASIANLIRYDYLTQCHKLAAALSKEGLDASSRHPVVAGDFALFQQKLFPINYYIMNADSTISDRRSELPAVGIGQQEPYYEIQNRKLILQPAGGSQVLLKSWFSASERIVLYRGVTHATEGEIWKVLKTLLRSPDMTIPKELFSKLDSLAEQDAMLAKVWTKMKGDFKEGQLTCDQLATAILEAEGSRKGNHTQQVTFTSPDIRAAASFSGMMMDPDEIVLKPRILVFSFKPTQITKMETQGIYAGIENYYLEVGFSSIEARKFLAKAFDEDSIILPKEYPVVLKQLQLSTPDYSHRPWPEPTEDSTVIGCP